MPIGHLFQVPSLVLLAGFGSPSRSTQRQVRASAPPSWSNEDRKVAACDSSPRRGWSGATRDESKPSSASLVPRGLVGSRRSSQLGRGPVDPKPGFEKERKENEMDWTFFWETEPTCKSRREGEKNVHGGGRRGQARRDALEFVTKRTGMAAAGRVVYGSPSYNNGPVRLVVEVRTSCASENWARVRSRGELRPTRPGLWGLRIVSPRFETDNSHVTCVSPVVCKGSEQSSSSRRSRTVETKASMEVGRERAFQRSTSV